jgi:hypothetical protein
MQVRRLIALVLLVASGVLASVCWFLAAEEPRASESEPTPAVESTECVHAQVAEAEAGRSGPWCARSSSPRGT